MTGMFSLCSSWVTCPSTFCPSNIGGVDCLALDSRNLLLCRRSAQRFSCSVYLP